MAVDEQHAVTLSVEGPRQQRRWTVALRIILFIPHYFLLGAVGTVASIAAVIAWFAALFTGRLPDGIRTFLAGYLQYQARVSAWAYQLLTDEYPPFELQLGSSYPINVEVPPADRLSRSSIFFRFILVIPSMMLLAFAMFGLMIAAVVVWLIVLIAGRMPTSLFWAEAAILRYQVRVYGYAFMLTSEYPRALRGDTIDDDAPLVGGNLLDEDFEIPDLETRPRITRLVLTTASRRLVALFVVLGIVATVAFFAAAVIAAANTDSASEDLRVAHQALAIELDTFSATAQNCAVAGGIECIHGADRRLAAAFERFRDAIGSISYPGGSVALADQLDDDAVRLITLLDQMAATSDPQQFQTFAQQFQTEGNRFDADFERLYNATVFS
jgi:hypothetical protein